MKHFLTLSDWSASELEDILSLAISMKSSHEKVLKGKTLGMLFQHLSTRTRISFEVGMFQLGGLAINLPNDQLHLQRGESISDTARVLSRYLDGMMGRFRFHQDLSDFAQYSKVPVINGLTDFFHPCQIMADLLTIKEKKGQLHGIKIAYLGDGNNVSHSLLIGAALMGMNLSLACPRSYGPLPEVLEKAKDIASKSGATIQLTSDPMEAASQADILYTDTWVSMGIDETKIRLDRLRPFQVNQNVVKHCKDDYLFMHCLPAKRGQEVTSDIIDGPHSIVFDQAENRLHVQKAILVKLLA